MLDSNTLHQRFEALMQDHSLIHNLHTDIVSYQQNNTHVIASVNNFHHHNCYVCSPLTQIIYYARDEIPKVDSASMRAVSYALTYALELPLRLGQVDRIQVLNNQCLSTNFYSNQWRDIALPDLRQQAIARYPKHLLMLRSLNKVQHSDLIDQAEQDGWLPVVSRQVYLFTNKETWWQHSNSRADAKLLKQADWSFAPLDPDNTEQMQTAEHLYSLLYLEKYSGHNVAFSAEYFRLMVQNQLLQLYGLFHQGELLGVVGLFGVDQTITVPVVGYDTHRSPKLALYRRLMAFAMDYAMQRDLQLNLSSGSPRFKRLRGGQSEIEYSYVYVKHLNRYQRMLWKSLSTLATRFYQPILEDNEL